MFIQVLSSPSHGDFHGHTVDFAPKAVITVGIGGGVYKSVPYGGSPGIPQNLAFASHNNHGLQSV